MMHCYFLVLSKYLLVFNFSGNGGCLFVYEQSGKPPFLNGGISSLINEGLTPFLNGGISSLINEGLTPFLNGGIFCFHFHNDLFIFLVYN